MRTVLLQIVLAAVPILVAAAAKVDPIQKDGKGLALRGYDPVAYFTESQPRAGSADFTHRWGEATWQFVSAAHRDSFAADPVRYGPQFGGYCAWAVSNNYTAPIDPQAWRIVDGKLYLNYNKAVQVKWEKDREERIRAAEKNWPALHK